MSVLSADASVRPCCSFHASIDVFDAVAALAAGGEICVTCPLVVEIVAFATPARATTPTTSTTASSARAFIDPSPLAAKRLAPPSANPRPAPQVGGKISALIRSCNYRDRIHSHLRPAA